MNRIALLSTALLIVVLSCVAFISEILIDKPGQQIWVPALFVVLSLLTAVGLIRRVPIARPVAALLYLLTALGCAFQVVVFGFAFLQIETFDWEIFTQFSLNALTLILVVWSLWWLTKPQTIAVFRDN